MPAASGAAPMPNIAPSSVVATSTAHSPAAAQNGVVAPPKVLPLEPDAATESPDANHPSLADETSAHSFTTSRASSTRNQADGSTESQYDLKVPALQDEGEAVNPDEVSDTITFPNPITEQPQGMPSVISEARPQSGRVLPL